MNRIFISTHGEILKCISGNEHALESNTEPGDIYVDIEEGLPSLKMYWDGLSNSFKEMGTPSNSYMQFDYVLKKWFDPRSLEQIKKAKWEELKNQRDLLEFGGFSFKGNIYDSDQVSQGRIIGAMLAGVDQIWTLADNTTIALSAVKLQELYQALQQHVADVHERGRIARNAIEAATTKEEVVNIIL